ncbi:MAG: anaerobic sulfatase maturase [Armatimonadota bacterium]|nr:anaerobic sulfatase maturase [bacterium]
MSHYTGNAFHVMAKPTGAVCNLRCNYCFFLKKEHLYPGSSFRMTDEIMENYIRQTIEAHHTPSVTIAWQGGEPTLMGLDFFRRSIEIERKYHRPGMTIENTIQTNGVLIDEDWCRFLHDNHFLVGLSLDGPKDMHDAYRRDRAGNSVYNRVIRAVKLMQAHDVQFNILCTVNAINSKHPLRLYRFFRDKLQTSYLQFIPIVERVDSSLQEGGRVTDTSVGPEQYGRFLIEIFDEWVRRDVGRVFVQFFDGVLASWLHGRSTLCVLGPTCGESVVLEHNGDVYSCDHFVEPEHLLGNITQMPIDQLVNSERQRCFGSAKFDALPGYCHECKYLFTCHGECPKNRFLHTPDGEVGLNYLCAGLRAFFEHSERPMRIMADLLRRGHYADEVMRILAIEEGVAIK